MVLSFAYQVILILCIFLFCSFCILLFAHSRQRKLNLFHWGTIFSISFVHLSLKNKKLNLFHPILNIGQGKGQFCQKNLKTQSIPPLFWQGEGPFRQKNLKLNISHSILKIRQGRSPFCQKNLKTQSIPLHFEKGAGQRHNKEYKKIHKRIK